MFNKYLKLSSNKKVMYINCTTEDGNITYVDSNGTTYFYELRNVFFHAPAETKLNGETYSLEM
jgi:carbonic anhydrase